LPTDFPPLRTSNARLGNLPRQMSSFVGRADELAQVAQALRDRPLVTLTGVGGSARHGSPCGLLPREPPGSLTGAWLMRCSTSVYSWDMKEWW
jgi:hypothetical protein